MSYDLVHTPFPHDKAQEHSTSSMGVMFHWYGKQAEESDETEAKRREWFQKGFKAVIADALRRQRRTHPEFWDAMTYFERIGLPASLTNDFEANCAMALIATLPSGNPDEEVVNRLAHLAVIECSRSRLALNREDSIYSPRGMTPRTGTPIYPWLPKDPDQREGFHRVLEVDLSAMDYQRATMDVARLLILAVLVQIHAELEVFYETGFLRLRKCERETCGAWFCAKQMDSRSRFCSTTCRVGNARESTRRSRPRKSQRS